MTRFPKYMDIVLWTQKQIEEGVFSPGDKFLSEAALGERFAVSRQTVRRALDELTQDGHVTRLQGSGTYISAAPFPQKETKENKDAASSMNVGIISIYLDDYIFPGIIRGIEGVFTANGYGVQLASTQNETTGEARALERMLESRLAGLIVEPTMSGLPCVNLELYRRIEQRGIPLVFTDSRYAEVAAPYVALDDEAVGYLATKHLIDMGHHSIAGIFTHSNHAGHLRYLGYMKALAAHGLPRQEDRVHWYTQDDMEQVLNSELFSKCLPSCSAALCYNDRLAMVLTELLKQRGLRVPEDLSVVSVDNTALAQLGDFTSIVHPSEKLGEAAAKLLLSMIHGAKGENILFPPELVARASVRRLEG